ncbi:hypothetical protein FRB99_005461 [Tulasnella sp. 403]|nr:hypothetical protein FRB99_005461 [Tulasnella sp. 403]
MLTQRLVLVLTLLSSLVVAAPVKPETSSDPVVQNGFGLSEMMSGMDENVSVVGMVDSIESDITRHLELGTDPKYVREQVAKLRRNLEFPVQRTDTVATMIDDLKTLAIEIDQLPEDDTILCAKQLSAAAGDPSPDQMDRINAKLHAEASDIGRGIANEVQKALDHNDGLSYWQDGQETFYLRDVLVRHKYDENIKWEDMTALMILERLQHDIETSRDLPLMVRMVRLGDIKTAVESYQNAWSD